MEIVNLIVLLFLVVVMILDIKLRLIPSVLLTGMLLVVGIIHLELLPFGLLALGYAWFLKDADFIRGMADVKVMGIIGLFVTNIYFFMIFMLAVVVLGSVYKWGIYFIMKKPSDYQVPFIPVLVLVFVAIIELQVGWL